MEQTLAMLRQLKYTENVMFAGNGSIHERHKLIRKKSGWAREEPSNSDVEMILLDLL
jgi:hypothetical protein